MTFENFDINLSKRVSILWSYDCLIGLKMEDFSKESQGEMVIEFLQMKHKCVITVQDSANDTRHYVFFVFCLLNAQQYINSG